ncbi:MAG: hypothetical protein KJN66_04860, partial [Bacteroidia bacterium]|nr:hypothetical protein [Bacteroidia bacterium]
MKKLALLFLSLLFTASCSKNDVNNKNPFLPNYSFDTGDLINTALPLYSTLNNAGSHFTIGNNYGINGVVIYYSGTNYSAFELSDPNHTLQTCSILSIQGVVATCSCDDGNSYDILVGLPREGTT